ncbi:MAG: Ig-like domain-containing protein, partial [Candidatus Kapabacteria bacterium]|nr:Ig-like domain-containing protein [Candidatus Kapabacteria bacterium]
MRIFDKDGNQLGTFDANLFFGSSDKFFDPRVAYDPWRDRYLILYLRINDAARRSFWALAISKTNTPTANPADWWQYFIPVPDSHRLTHWIDFPYLGFDRDAVYITGTLFSWDGTGESGISCFRVLNKDEIYFGLNWSSWIFVDFESSGSNDSHVCPVQMWSEVNNPRTAYIVSTKIFFHNTLVVRRIFWSGSSWSQMWVNGPTLSTEVVPVPAYARPPDIEQPGGVQPLDNIDCRLMSATFHNGVIYATQSVAYDWGYGNRAAIRLYRLVVGATSTSASSVIFGAEGWDYFYPAASHTREGDMILSFGRANADTFAQCRVTGWRHGQTSPEPSSLVRAGEAPYYRVADGRNRWGDYFGAATDPWDQLTVWVVGQYARQNNEWGTWIAETNYKPLTVVEVANVQGYAGLTVTLQATLRRADTNAPLPGETIRFIVRGVFVGSGITDGNGVATYRYAIPSNLGAGQHTITAEFVRTP